MSISSSKNNLIYPDDPFLYRIQNSPPLSSPLIEDPYEPPGQTNSIFNGQSPLSFDAVAARVDVFDNQNEESKISENNQELFRKKIVPFLKANKSEKKTVVKVKKTAMNISKGSPVRFLEVAEKTNSCSTLNCPHGIRPGHRQNPLTGKYEKCDPCFRMLSRLVDEFHTPHMKFIDDYVQNCSPCIKLITSEFEKKIANKKPQNKELCQNDNCKTKYTAVGPNAFNYFQRLDGPCYDFVRNAAKSFHDKHLKQDPTAQKSPHDCRECLEKTQYYCTIETGTISYCS